jgi:hypothetical protein
MACVPAVFFSAGLRAKPASILFQKSKRAITFWCMSAFAISVVDKEEAERTYALLESMGYITDELAVEPDTLSRP